MKPYKEQTYYELLEVDPSASTEEIRAAYERSIRLYDSENVALYPLGDSAQVEELKKLLLEAMEILTDPDLRIEYDRSLGIATADRASAPTAPEAAKVALEEPPGPSEIDARAAASRKEADAQVQQAAQELADRAQRAAAPVEPGSSEIPGLNEVDARAEVRAAHAEPSPPGLPEEPAEPAQLVMVDVVSRAETIHSTAPRYSISYIPRAPAPARSEAPAELPPQSTTGAPRFAEAGPSAAASTHEPTARATPAPSSGESSGRALQPEQGAPSASAPPSPARDMSARPTAERAAPPPTGGEVGTPPPPAPAPPPPRATPEEPSAPRPPSRALEQAPVIAQEAAIAAAESALAQVAAHAAQRAREPKPRPMEIPEDAVYNGELLRQVRQNRGVSLQQLADKTRISIRHLENVEADRYDALPATVYLRGILMSVARELGLDPLRASKSYLALVEKERGKK